MALNQDIQVTLKAIDQTTAAFASFNKNLNGVKDTALKIGAAIGSALAVRDVINTMDEWTTSVRRVQAVTGLAATDASRLTFAAQALGVQGDELSLSLDRLAKNMFATHQSVGKGTSAFDQWGISLKDAQGNIRNINDILEQAATKVQQMGDGAASTALEMDLFGRSGGRLHDLLMQGGEGVRQLEAESDQLGLTLNNNTLAQMRQFQIESNVSGEAVDGLKVQLGIALLPILNQIVISMTQFISTITNSVLHSREFAGALKTVWSAFQLVLGIVKETFDKLNGLVGSVGATQIAVDALVLAIAGIAGGPIGLAIAAVALAFEEVGKTIDLIRNNWNAFVQALLSGKLDGLISLLGPVGVAILVVKDAVVGLAGAFNDAQTYADGLLTGIQNLFAYLQNNPVISTITSFVAKIGTLLGLNTGVPSGQSGSGSPAPGSPQGLDYSTAIGAAANAVTGGVAGLTTAIFSANPSLLSALHNAGIPGFASGGTVPGPIGSPMLAVVHGGETVSPAGGGNTFNINVSNVLAGSAQEIAEAIADAVGDVLVRRVVTNRQVSY